VSLWFNLQFGGSIVRAFVTGGTGFIGGNLIRLLLSDGIEVRALVRPGSDRRNLEGLPLDIVEGTLEDEPLLGRALEDCRWLFHAAAHYSLCRRDRDAIYLANVEGSKKIFRAARAASVERIVYTSSVAAIGLAPGEAAIADESNSTTVDELVSDYKRSKYLAEQAAFEAAGDGLPVVIVNPSTPIGPFDVKPTPTGEIILKFLRRQMPFYVHTGLNIIDVRDVARGHILAAERGRVGERYILGHRNVTLKQLLDMLSNVTGLASPRHSLPHWLPVAVGYIDELLLSPLLARSPAVTVNGAKMARHAMYYTSEKAVTEIGLPQSPIEDALRLAVDWFRQNRYF
jgi:dihydroflavonol-4-reductase